MREMEGIILDWAGTTVDFGCFAPVAAFLRSFAAVGIDVTVAEAREPMGMLKRDHIQAMLAMPRLRALWRERYQQEPDAAAVEAVYRQFEPLLLASLSDYAAPLPGVRETVAVLRQQGLKIGSTTGYTTAMLNDVRKAAQQQGYAPDCWVTPDAVGGKGRPYPYMIFRNMEQLGLSTTWRVVKVGDTVSDMREAVQAGVWAVGVICGSSLLGLSAGEWQALAAPERQTHCQRAADAFYQAGADVVIAGFSELPSTLEEIGAWVAAGRRPGGR